MVHFLRLSPGRSSRGWLQNGSFAPCDCQTRDDAGKAVPHFRVYCKSLDIKFMKNIEKIYAGNDSINTFGRIVYFCEIK
jgi:hypothetical protein